MVNASTPKSMGFATKKLGILLLGLSSLFVGSRSEAETPPPTGRCYCSQPTSVRSAATSGKYLPYNFDIQSGRYYFRNNIGWTRIPYIETSASGQCTSDGKAACEAQCRQWSGEYIYGQVKSIWEKACYQGTYEQTGALITDLYFKCGEKSSYVSVDMMVYTHLSSSWHDC